QEVQPEVVPRAVAVDGERVGGAHRALAASRGRRSAGRRGGDRGGEERLEGGSLAGRAAGGARVLGVDRQEDGGQGLLVEDAVRIGSGRAARPGEVEGAGVDDREAAGAAPEPERQAVRAADDRPRRVDGAAAVGLEGDAGGGRARRSAPGGRALARGGLAVRGRGRGRCGGQAPGQAAPGVLGQAAHLLLDGSGLHPGHGEPGAAAGGAAGAALHVRAVARRRPREEGVHARDQLRVAPAHGRGIARIARPCPACDPCPPMRAAPVRLIAMAQGGRHVVIRRADGARLLESVELVDALGTAPRRALPTSGLIDFACVGDEVWLVDDGGSLRRHDLHTGEPAGDEVALGVTAGRLRPATGGSDPGALWTGPSRLLLRAADGRVEIEDVSADVPEDAFATAVAGRRLIVASGRRVSVRDAGKGDVGAAVLPGQDGDVVAGGALFGGRAVAVLSGHDGVSAFDVVRPGGSLVHHIDLPGAARCALADARGLAVVTTAEGRLLAVDLRYGRVIGDEEAPIEIADLCIDSGGRFLALAGYREEGGPLRVLHIPYTDLFGGRRAGGAPRPGGAVDAGAEPAPPAAPAPAPKAEAKAEAGAEAEQAAKPPQPGASP